MYRTAYEDYPEPSKQLKGVVKLLLMGSGVILAGCAALGIFTNVDGVDTFSDKPKTQEDKNVTNIEIGAAVVGTVLTMGALILDQKQS